MSSTERAPEPTMEEILASIRRIISEEEAKPAPQDASAEGEIERPHLQDADFEAADTQIIDDIARVLSGATPAAETSEASDDEILDLGDLGVSGPDDGDSGGMALADAEFEIPDMGENSGGESEAVVVTDEVVAAVAATQAPKWKADFSSAFPPQDQAPTAAPVNAPVPPVAAPVPPIAEPTPAPVQAARVGTEEAFEDPTSALERAIAALKSGDLTAFAREAEPKPPAFTPSSFTPTPPSFTPAPPSFTPAPAAPPVFTPEPQAAPFTPPPTAEQPDAVVVPTGEPQMPEEATAKPSPEPITPEMTPESMTWPEPTRAPEPQFEAEPEPASAPWRSEELTWDSGAPFRETKRTNGTSGHEPHNYNAAAPKTLEDSVKEMLRPMLRKWLDENMSRVLTAALREELEERQPAGRDS